MSLPGKFFGAEIASEGTIALIEQVWRDKYQFDNEQTPNESLIRVAKGVYENDTGGFTHFEKGLNAMQDGYWCPAGRIQAGAGTPKRVTWINCYVMSTIPDSLDGIMDVLKEAALTQQQGGGVGMDFSSLRPRGAVVVRTGSVSSGPIPFMRMWHSMCSTIRSSGSRRGAMMAVLRVDHPDIEEFIEVKHTPGELTNFNISVAITDKFMEAVKGDNEWELGFCVPPADGNAVREYTLPAENTPWYVYKVVKARELWQKILKSTFDYAEPGVIFIDRINNRNNNLYYCETIAATNPCVAGNTKISSPAGLRNATNFKPGNLITTAAGTLRKIESIEIEQDVALFRVTFNDGGYVDCTAGHQFYARKEASKKFEPFRLSELRPGDAVKIVPLAPRREFLKGRLDFENLGLRYWDDYGWIIGRTWAIGREVTFKTVKSYNKKLYDCMDEKFGWLFQEGGFPAVLDKNEVILKGFIDAVLSHCAVLDDDLYSQPSVKIKVPHTKALARMRMFFMQLGMFPTKDGDTLKLYGTDLEKVCSIISNKFLANKIATAIIGLDLEAPLQYARIESITPLGDVEMVYDIYEPTTDTYVTNGYVSKGCVPYETPLLTREGYAPIGSLVGQSVDVWNGEEFSPVVPFETGVQRLYKVTFDNGVEFVCDSRHRFPIVDRGPIYTCDLKPGYRLEKTTMPVVEKGRYYTVDGYSQGFYAGDGSKGLKKSFVPVDGAIDYCLDWLAGLCDADGTLDKKKNGSAISITSVDKEFLDRTRLMLTRLGVQAVVKPEHKTGRFKTMPGGTYYTRPSYRLQIGLNDVKTLLELGFKTQRLEITLRNQNPPKNASRFIRVKAVEKLDRVEKTYCVTEEKRERAVFQGLTTFQCGEQPLPPNGACNLGAVNLARLVRNPFTINASIDYEALEETVRIGVRFLDNVLDVTPYPLEAQREEAMNKRRIGLGVTGLGNMLQMMCLRYGSEEGNTLIHQVMGRIMNWAYSESALLAKERGPFPLYDEEILHSFNVRRLDNDVYGLVKENGLRNGVILTIAPTGTTSIYYGNISSGIEPTFSWEYERNVRREGKDDEWDTFQVRDYAFEMYCRHHGEPDRGEDGQPIGLPGYMVTALELPVQAHLEVQAICQKYVDASISKTINCPEDMTFEEFEAVYAEAYERGCKGCTTYKPSPTRGWILSTGSNKQGVSSNGTSHSQNGHEPVSEIRIRPRIPRPEEITGVTYKLVYPSMPHAFYITINDVILANGRIVPYEMFINTKDVTLHEWLHALTRLTSAVFQRAHGDIEFLVEELQQVYSVKTGAWHEGEYSPSFVAAIGKILKRHLARSGYLGDMHFDVVDAAGDPSPIFEITSNGSHAPMGEQCSSCGSFSAVPSGGCFTCTQCGYSKCS